MKVHGGGKGTASQGTKGLVLLFSDVFPCLGFFLVKALVFFKVRLIPYYFNLNGMLRNIISCVMCVLEQIKKTKQMEQTDSHANQKET